MRKIAVFACLAASALAQNPAPPAFEVASVKVSRDDPSTARSVIATPGESLTMRNLTLRRIVAWAYDVQPPQVAGPAWIDTEKYEVLAKAGHPAPPDEMRPMLRTLLAERWKLETHRETRQMQAAAIVQGKTGHKMTPSANQGPTRIRQDPDRGPIIEGAALRELANELSQQVNLTVVDLTGLAGRFDFAFNPQKYVAAMRARYAADPNRPPEQEMQYSLVEDAIGGDLGLRIERRKMDIDVVVIDRCEKVPIEN